MACYKFGRVWAMDYVFYFDETYHDRKIVFSSDGTINTLQEDKSDSYIGAFWGCQQNQLRRNISWLEKFDAKYKDIFGLPNNKELKSVTIHSKNFRYGISSFNQNTMSFYTDLFQMLYEMKVIIQIDIISKIEFLVRSIFNQIQFPYNANENSFYYSLTKFIVSRRPKQFIHTLASVSNGSKAQIVKDALLDTLEKVIQASIGIARKEKEIKAFQQIRMIVYDMDFDFTIKPKTDFIYFQNFDGLSRLLEEIDIDIRHVKLVIDKEEATYQAATNFNFGKIKQADSYNSVQLRLSDFLCGFIGRIIYAMAHDPSSQEQDILDYNNIDTEDLQHKRLLSEKWFDLKETQYNLYLLIYQVLIIQQEHYWSSMTMSYSDDVSCFYSLLRYIANYKNYDDFRRIDNQMHAEYYNSCCLNELERYYREM